VRFLRQLAAAAAVVAVVVLLGLAWNRFAPSLPGEGPAGHGFALRGQMVKVLPPGVKPRSGGRILAGAGPPPGIMRNSGSGTPSLLLGDLLEPANLAVLRQSALIEAAVIAAVVIVNASYRRLRRNRRARTSAARPGPTDVR
jgi:hypothetical protein